MKIISIIAVVITILNISCEREKAKAPSRAGSESQLEELTQAMKEALMKREREQQEKIEEIEEDAKNLAEACLNAFRGQAEQQPQQIEKEPGQKDEGAQSVQQLKPPAPFGEPPATSQKGQKQADDSAKKEQETKERKEKEGKKPKKSDEKKDKGEKSK